jgi:formylglycine-generating enzyme required for sulfatase activity
MSDRSSSQAKDLMITATLTLLTATAFFAVDALFSNTEVLGEKPKPPQEASWLQAESLPRRELPLSPRPRLPPLPQQRPVDPNSTVADAAQGPGDTRVGGVGMHLAWVPPGRFFMGSPNGDPWRDSDEGPRHLVTIARGFWMGTTEVTEGQYATLMDMERPMVRGQEFPVEDVTWDQAKAFAKALTRTEQAAGRLPRDWSYRLPSEAEWEYAARAGTRGTVLSGPLLAYSDFEAPSLDPFAWWGGNTRAGNPQSQKDLPDSVQPVGQKRANSWGLQDMQGNAWEWVADLWHDNYEGAPTDGSTWYQGGNPERYVRRGGSWKNRARYLRLANRGSGGASCGCSTQGGFRIVVAPNPG